MFNLIKNINENSKIEIKGRIYNVLAKVVYVTESDQNNWYVKVQLDNHHVLVISPFDNYMYFGYVDKPVACDIPTPEKIYFEGKMYIKQVDDYQMVKEFVFGDFLSMEGEVFFSDYECSENDKDIISIGLIKRTEKRADVIAKVIELADVKII